MSQCFYDTWKDDKFLPIECLINTILLYKEYRKIVQIDMTYYDNNDVKNRIKEFATSCQNIIKREDEKNNIIMYLVKHEKVIEERLKDIGNGNIYNAFYTGGFSDLLDPIFYSYRGNWPSILNQKQIVQLSFNVVEKTGKKAGAILVQMSDKKLKHLEKLYNYFLIFSKYIEEIDDSLQTTFIIHTKPGLWKETNELQVYQYKILE